MSTGKGVGTGGFTLVELVVVILIAGILAAAVGLFVGAPVRGFLDQSRRAQMTDAADLALLQIVRDLRSALPNSIRVRGQALELLRTLDGERYRTEGPGAPADRLDFDAADTSFATWGRLNGGAIPAGARLAIYPLGEAGFDPWVAGDGVMTRAATAIADAGASGDEWRLTLTPAHRFPFDSPGRRVYLVEGPVSWLCTGGELRRYQGYAPQPAQPASAATLDALDAEPALIVDHVAGCAFAYRTNSLTSVRNGVVTLAIELVSQVPGSESEPVRLLRQVHVDNSP